jgi:hypothetical protein
MNGLTAYKIINYILLPIAGLFGFMCLVMLFMALANPAIILPVAMMSAVVVYIILSFIFLIKGISQLKKMNPSLRNWIKTTAYVTLFFSVNILISGIAYLYKPGELAQIMEQSLAMQKNMTPVSPELLSSFFKGTLYFMIFFATTLLIHVFETFKFLKLYAALFSKE